MQEYIFQIVAPIVSALAAWFFARRKNSAEADSVELENVQKAITIWRESATELAQKVSLLTAEIEQLREENISLKMEIKALQTQMHQVNLKAN